MADWFETNRNLILLGLAAAAVTIPLLIGVLKKQIPREFLSSWVVPLAVSTFLLALGVQAVERYLTPGYRLILSFLFAALWITAGAHISFVLPRRGLPEIYHRGAKNIGAMFFGFGVLWAGVSLFQFWTR
ncbi:MAG: hypothetical protein V1798_05870 [Pseudomonadota bacterium]